MKPEIFVPEKAGSHHIDLITIILDLKYVSFWSCEQTSG